MGVFAILGKLLFSKLPFCSAVGAVLGVVSGFLFGILMLNADVTQMSFAQICEAGVMLGMVSALFGLFVFGIQLRFRWNDIFWPTCGNAILTGIATVAINVFFHAPIFAAILGVLVGILVGAVFCRLCKPARDTVEQEEA